MVPLSEQRSRVLILVNSCVHILYGVAALVLASLAVGLISDETHAADNGIQRNWETNMIIDIQSSKAESCPLGYEPMFNFNWPGISKACNCQLWNENPPITHGTDGEYLTRDEYQLKKVKKDDYSQWINQSNEHENTIEDNMSTVKATKEEILDRLAKFGQENKIYTGELCNWNQTQAGCSDINEIKAQSFSKWKQRLNWCVVRAQSINMVNMYKYYDAANGTCTNDNLRVCGDPDQPDFQFCFPKTYPACPINSVLIRTHPPNGQDALYYNSHPIQFSKSHVLYYSRTVPMQLPISEFVISEDKPCIDGQGNISEEHQDYILSKKQRKRCEQTDQRYQLIDSQSEQSFFYNNEKLYLRDVLPDFTFNSTFQYGLYSKNFIQWKHNCSKHIDDYLLSNSAFDQFYSREWTLKIVTWLTIIFTILMAIFEMLLICKLPFVLNIEKPLLQWSPAVQIALALVLLPFNAAALHQALALNTLENTLVSNQCTDEFTLNLIGSSSSNIHVQVATFNKGEIFCVCLILLINVIVLLINLCCSKSTNVRPQKKRRASTY